MQTMVAKWGNSLALRIPAAFAKEMEIEEGRAVEISVSDGKMVITPVTSIPVYDIEVLISQMDLKDFPYEEHFNDDREDESW